MSIIEIVTVGEIVVEEFRLMEKFSVSSRRSSGMMATSTQPRPDSLARIRGAECKAT